FVQANLRYRSSVDAAVQGADHVVNCVGILFESGRNGFDAVQDFGARAVAEAARSVGATLTHISAIGADAKSDSAYAATKGRAEAAVQSILPDATILRPSIVFGPEDGFFNKFASMARIAPALPLVGGGKTRFQPVYVGDVAEVVARAVDGTIARGKIYELGGQDVASFKQCLEMMLDVVGRKRALVNLPFGIASLIGSIASAVPLITPPLTSDQVKLLKKDNVVSPAAKAEGRTLEGLGIQPVTMAAILPTYLVQYRVHGQYTGSGKAA
ncbi:MAG: complex I NDUFA9 subunit family protein, partial [Pseudomonadota bacterium]|nr:complex I NDUFA9 subunit family protein [Pseudomonadota bacterium]